MISEVFTKDESYFFMDQDVVSSGNQTWFTGIVHFGSLVFPLKPSFGSGISQPAMFNTNLFGDPVIFPFYPKINQHLWLSIQSHYPLII